MFFKSFAYYWKIDNSMFVARSVSFISIQWNLMQINSIQINSVQFNSSQFNSIKLNSILFNSIQFNSIQYNYILSNSTQFHSIQFNLIQFISIQFNSIVYYRRHRWTVNCWYQPVGIRWLLYDTVEWCIHRKEQTHARYSKQLFKIYI